MFLIKNMLKLEQINHAGFILNYNNISLACDRWLEGNLFNKFHL
jgi:L-ascorbate metabolism protein UlaG (beta-lactamase superfamily)